MRHDTKTVALDALATGRVMEATLMLTEYWGLDRALSAMAPERKPKVGDILTSSWGYDQTNIDYYEVVKVTSSSVYVRELDKRASERREYDDLMVPVPGSNKDGPTKLKRYRLSADYGYGVNMSSYEYAHLWDGTPRSQTGAMYGH